MKKIMWVCCLLIVGCSSKKYVAKDLTPFEIIEAECTVYAEEPDDGLTALTAVQPLLGMLARDRQIEIRKDACMKNKGYVLE